MRSHFRLCNIVVVVVVVFVVVVFVVVVVVVIVVFDNIVVQTRKKLLTTGIGIERSKYLPSICRGRYYKRIKMVIYDCRLVLTITISESMT